MDTTGLTEQAVTVHNYRFDDPALSIDGYDQVRALSLKVGNLDKLDVVSSGKGSCLDVVQKTTLDFALLQLDVHIDKLCLLGLEFFDPIDELDLLTAQGNHLLSCRFGLSIFGLVELLDALLQLKTLDHASSSDCYDLALSIHLIVVEEQFGHWIL